MNEGVHNEGVMYRAQGPGPHVVSRGYETQAPDAFRKAPIGQNIDLPGGLLLQKTSLPIKERSHVNAYSNTIVSATRIKCTIQVSLPFLRDGIRWARVVKFSGDAGG
jgi:hypothetical protein